LIIKIFTQLSGSGFGKSIVLFKKWRSLPEKKDFRSVKRNYQFHSKLQAFVFSRLGLSSNPLKNSLAEGKACKIQCINNLLKKTMSEHQKSFLNWKQQTKFNKILNLS